ncbi:MAG: 5-oxoprolinase subunit PxpA [Eudoraea sp.]|nr:5-oxoprolinase subunit PxpA [Eudoraea sp.]
MEKELRIDLNCDVGEGVGNEALLFPLISSCNIACGGHAGDASSIREILKLAKTHQVKVGAHPSYPDREHFGRISIDMTEEALKQTIQEQLQLFFRIADEEGIPVHHIKPHGALYNDIAKDEGLADAFLAAVDHFLQGRILYAPFRSVIAQQAKKAGFEIWHEAFADRNYNKDLSLVSRNQDDALITDPKRMKEHVLRILKEQTVQSIEGDLVPLHANTFCVHGDTPNAEDLLDQLLVSLGQEQILIDK